MIIIGVTGTNGAGKGTVAKYLVENKNYNHFSARAYITEEIVRRGLNINRENMIDIGNEWRAKFGTSYVAERLFEKAIESGKNCVIESIRNVGEIDSLRKKGKFYLVAVDANPKIRYKRIRQRDNETDMMSYNEFLRYETLEAASTDSTKVNLFKCIELADFVILNNRDVNDLYQKIEEILNEIQKSGD